MAPVGMMTDKRQTILALLALAVLSLCLYANTLDNDFVLDDTAYIRDNYLLRDLSNLPKFFNVPPDAVVEDLAPGFLKGRNIRWVTFALDYAIGGGSPWVFHLSNILWHFLTCVLLFFLLRKWLGSTSYAFVGAALFLSHPIQTNAVAYIFGRKDVLAACFVLVSFLAVCRFRDSGKRPWFWAAGGSFFIACFSKEMAVVFPLLLFWSDFCLRGDEGGGRTFVSNSRRYWREYLFFSILAGLFVWRQYGAGLISGLVEKTNQISHTAAATGGVAESANLSFANIIIFYFWKLVYPVELLADYKGVFHFSLYPVKWGWILSFLFVCMLVFFLLWLRRRWPEGALGIGWTVIALLPVSHIVDFHYPVAEHYLYLPCAGFVLVLTSSFHRMEKVVGRPAFLAVALVLLSYGGGTVRRNVDWQNMETVTRDILEKAPDHVGARSTLVHLLMEEGRYDEATTQALRILQLNPFSPVNHYNLGILYEETGDIDKAISHYRYSISLQKTMWDAYLNLGNLLLVHDREREGYEVISRLTKLYGYHPLAYWVLGNDKARKGSWAEALTLFRRAVTIDPQGAPGYLGVAGALWHIGEIREAEGNLLKALELRLDMGWAKEQEPWATFLERADVQRFLGTIEAKKEQSKS